LRVAIFYFTGTGNTQSVAEGFAAAFRPDVEVSLHNVESLPLGPAAALLRDCDLAGFGSPVYGFAVPRPFDRFLRALPHSPGQRAFLFLTMGGAALGALHHPRRLLERNGFDVVNSSLFLAPSNVFVSGAEGGSFVYRLLWYTERQHPARLLEHCRTGARETVAAILSGQRCHVRDSLLARLASWAGRLAVFTSAWQMKLVLGTRRTCNRCGICVRSCPQGNIRLTGRRVRFGWRCAMCYRCINICPVRAVRLRWPASFFDNRAQYVCPGWQPPVHDR